MRCGPALGSPEDWVFKGEGAANIVYSYQGTLPQLVGRVLKLRKRSPDAGDAADTRLELAAWAPVLGAEQRPSLQRELLYSQRCLAPLLGAGHIPEQVPVCLPKEFVRQLPCAAEVDPAGASAVLMPDVTLFAPAGLASSCFGACGGERCGAEDAAAAAAGAAAGPGSALAPAPAAAAQAAGAAGGGAAPALCVEIKPKCGFLGSCNSVHPDNRVKHSKSRYQLHQLLKVEEGQVAARSSYDPLDLFCGEPPRQLAALRALLAAPQNNLKLFWGGQPVGVAQGLTAWAEAEAAGGGSATSGQQGPSSGCEAQERLLELLVQVLALEGALEGLLEAQRQCLVDIEGVHAVYSKLRDSMAGVAEAGCGSSGSMRNDDSSSSDRQRESAVLVCAYDRGCTANGGLERSVERSAAAPAPCSGSSSSNSNSRSDEEASRHAEQLQRLLALPEGEALGLLRRYVVAATARDCALMVALQRLSAADASAAAAAEGSPQPQSCGSGQGVVLHRPSSTWYRYRLAFVDLDMKPLAKIPHHYKLDQRILAAAQRHNAAEQQRQMEAA